MSKQDEHWRFAHAPNLTITGMNHSGEDRFSEHQYKSLAREVIQNSMDAKLPEAETVKVEFSTFQISTSEVPGIEYLKNNIIPKAKNFEKWKNSSDEQDYIQRVEHLLNADSLSVLKISDFNTTGLNKNQYDSIIGEGFSAKQNEDSQGSKGIGKAAPFANSNLRMVFYNSKSTSYGEKSVGIFHFLSFPYAEDDSDICEAKGMYVESTNNFINGQLKLKEPTTRTEFGTDLYIIGFNEASEWQDQLLHSILYNLLISIYENKISIKIDDIVLNSKTLPEIINRVNHYSSKQTNEYKNEFLEINKIYSVLTSTSKTEKKSSTWMKNLLKTSISLIRLKMDVS